MREPDEDAGTAAVTPAARISGSLHELVRWVGCASGQSRRYGEFGAGSSGFALLHQLHERGPCRSGELATALRVDPSTVSRWVSALEREGLLRREPDPEDRRACLLAVTENGDALLEERWRMRRRVVDRVLEGWNAADREALASLIARLNTACAEQLTTCTTELAEERAGPLRGSE